MSLRSRPRRKSLVGGSRLDLILLDELVVLQCWFQVVRQNASEELVMIWTQVAGQKKRPMENLRP